MRSASAVRAWGGGVVLACSWFSRTAAELASASSAASSARWLSKTASSAEEGAEGAEDAAQQHQTVNNNNATASKEGYCA